jgi:hypothetical protein
LAKTIAAQPGHHGPLDPAAKAHLVLAWSTVHGFANLALDGQMPFVEGPDPDAALMAMAERVIALVTTIPARSDHPGRKQKSAKKRHGPN